MPIPSRFEILSRKRFPIHCLKLFGIPFVFFIGLSCSKPFPSAPILDLLVIQDILSYSSTTNSSGTGDGSGDSNGTGDGTTDGTTDGTGDGTAEETPADTRKFIFPTQSTYNGNLGGLTGADSKCATEKTTNFSTLPGADTEYKALLADGTTRIACTSANCTDTAQNTGWVLKPGTDYYRPDESKIFTTNTGGIFPFGTMGNAFSTNGTDAWWTGLETDWTSSAVNDDCGNWASTVGNGTFGTGNLTTDGAIADFGADPCTNTKKILCVRQ